MITDCCRRYFGLTPIKTESQNVRDLKNALKEIDYRQYLLPGKYRSCPAGRVVAIAAIIIVVAVAVMASQGTLSSFPQNFVNFFKELNWLYVAGALTGGGVLTIAASFIFRRVIDQEEFITKHDIGKLTGDDHWVSAIYVVVDDDPKGPFSRPGHIDTSTLKNGSGKAFMYAYKDPINHYQVSAVVLATTPLYWIATIVYNTLRIFIIPFYIAFRILTDQPSSSDPDKNYRWSDITDEWKKTASRMATSLAYAWAYMLSALYSFIDPLNGRKLSSYVERDWNEGVTRAEGFWSVDGPQPLWKFEGGGKRYHLGKNGGCWAGCWHPIAVVTYSNDEIIECTSLSKAVKPKRGKVYTIFTAEMLAAQKQALLTQLQQAQAPTTN